MARKKGAHHSGKSGGSSRVSGGVNWKLANEGAQGLWEVLQMSRGPGKGVGVTCRVDPEDPGDNMEKAMLRSRAVDILLADHPELTCTVWQNDIFVAFRTDLEVLANSEAYKLTEASMGKRAGEDLVVRTLPQRSRKDEVLEQYPRWPGALQGKKPYEATDADWEEWREGLKAYRQREAARLGISLEPESTEEKSP